MTIFCYPAEASDAAVRAQCEALVHILERAGCTVVTTETQAHTIERSAHATSPLAQVDAFIVEGTDADPEAGFLLAFAMANNKPLLHLTMKGKSRKNPLATFEKTHRLPASVTMVHYNEQSLERHVLAFLAKLDDAELHELPSIKFTLRITPSIERYLEWKAKQTGVSKADYVRQFLVNEALKKDEQYTRRHAVSHDDTTPAV